MQQQLHDFWLETPIVIQKTWRDMETPEEMLREFILKETEFWKNFANSELNILRNARTKMNEIWKQ
jgi:hypothetical protein